MNKDLAVVTGYIMYYRMLEDKLNGSFFTQIDKAIEIAELFCSFYPADFKWEESDLTFEEILEEFLNKNI
mgnify:FL=1